MSLMNIDVSATRCVYKEEDVEPYLCKGWVLLSVRTETTDGPDGENSKFRALVGWPRILGEVHPPAKISPGYPINGSSPQYYYPFGWDAQIK